MDTTTTLLASAVTATGSTVAAFNGDNVMAWVMLVLNIITLTSNTLLMVYRKWRDRNDDKKNTDKDNDDKGVQ